MLLEAFQIFQNTKQNLSGGLLETQPAYESVSVRILGDWSAVNSLQRCAAHMRGKSAARRSCDPVQTLYWAESGASQSVLHGNGRAEPLVPAFRVSPHRAVKPLRLNKSLRSAAVSFYEWKIVHIPWRSFTGGAVRVLVTDLPLLSCWQPGWGAERPESAAAERCSSEPRKKQN